MTKERLEEAERILADYAAKYGLTDEARAYFSSPSGYAESVTVKVVPSPSAVSNSICPPW